MSLNINYKKYHWDKINKLEKDTNKIHIYYEVILKYLHKELNYFHNESNNQRYWELLIGPWLFQFIQFYFDKYEISKNYILKKKEKKFLNLDPLEKYSECYKFYVNDEYIEKTIYEIKELKKESKVYFFSKRRVVEYKNIIKKRHNNFKLLIMDLYFLFKRKKVKKKTINLNLPLLSRELIISSDYASKLYKPFGTIIDDLEIINNNISEGRNKKIFIDKKDDGFIRAVKSVILKKIPKEYLEYYGDYKSYYYKISKKNKCDVILVRSPLEISTKIRYLISLFYKLHKTKIFGFQEGGIGKFKYQKNYEKQQLIGCDNFFQWSRRKREKNTKNFFLTKTFWLKNYKVPKNKKILIVMGSFRKHFFSIYEGHMPGYSKHQLKITNNLINSLKKNYYENIAIRFHKDFGYGEQKLVKDRFPKLNTFTRENNNFFYDLLDKYSLKVFTSDYTANMQSILINHPSIILIDKKNLPFNPDYKEIYELLIKEKIYFDNPNDCSKHIKNIMENGLTDWWYSDGVQKAREKYLNLLCVKSNNLGSEILKILN